MGSLILSRSFHVEQFDIDQESSDGEDEGKSYKDDGMDVVEEDLAANPDASLEAVEEAVNDDDDDSDESENPEDVGMVPLADILNAKYGSANVGCSSQSLFYQLIHFDRLNCSMMSKIWG